MKKFLVAAVGVFLLASGVTRAQSLANGINDVYAERYLSAKSTFEKLMAANPNDIQATYWLGQAYLGMEDVKGARGVYEKGLSVSNNAPLLQAGMGEVELLENKVNEARQHFESAITMTSSRKGNDPEILNAVGRAIADVYTDKEKRGDINFAIQKLEEASQVKTKDNVLLADIYLNLGNAYRKARPGENGGLAFSSYQKAIEANPNFAPAYYNLARLFNTQHNWELYEKYLNDAISKDPRFAPAYYDLSYFKIGKQDLAAAEDYARKFAESSDADPQNEYLRGSILYAQKKYDEAISVGKSIESRLGERTKARVYKMLAYSYLDKKDTLTAKPYIDQYFAKAKPEEIIALDYGLKADIYLAIPGQEEVVFNSIMEGVKTDTVLENKLDLLKKGAAIFNARKQYDRESKLLQMILDIKPNVSLNDLFATGISYYRAKDYNSLVKGYNIFKTVAEKYPDQQFGWEWKYNIAILIDTVKKDSIAVPDALALIDYTKMDTVKFGRQLASASYFLANYYLEKENKEKAIEYLKIMKSASKDTAQRESIQRNIDELSRPTPNRPQTKPGANPPRNSTSNGPSKSGSG